MASDRSVLERQIERVELRPYTLDGFYRRRERKQRNRRVGSALVALVLAGAAIGGLLRVLSSGTVPGSDPRDPFLGEWVSTSDADGGTETMTVVASGELVIEITVHDDVASVCAGTPSTMTGAGRIVGITDLVIPSPEYTCDDGTEPEALSGPPLSEQLRNLTLVLDAQAEILTDGLGGVWHRPGQYVPTPPTQVAEALWPQSSLAEVQEAQRLADAGDPRYTWQIEPGLASDDPWLYLRDQGAAEIIARFLREERGWEGFLLNPYQGGADEDAAADGTFGDLVYLRCAPGETNSLYPNGPWGAAACAPTIDELRYEAVSLDVAQLGRRGPTGIWVVSRWATVEPFAQTAPPIAEGEALLGDFLQARVEGKGADGFVEIVHEWDMVGGLPLLYATTTGAPYERTQFERVVGPDWPYGDMEYVVQLFAEGGATVVEQRLSVRHDGDGRLWLEYVPTAANVAPTTEDGVPVAVPYAWFEGEVTVQAAYPWAESVLLDPALVLDRNTEERLELVGNPLPVETSCEAGLAAADAQGLAQAIRSDPDLEATAPVLVTIGGFDALQMDVTAAPGASVCEEYPGTQVLTPDDDGSWGGLTLGQGSRMRLYLLDAPEGSSIGILAIAIIAPESRFQEVVEAAAPIVDSFELRT